LRSHMFWNPPRPSRINQRFPVVSMVRNSSASSSWSSRRADIFVGLRLELRLVRSDVCENDQCSKCLHDVTFGKNTHCPMRGGPSSFGFDTQTWQYVSIDSMICFSPKNTSFCHLMPCSTRLNSSQGTG